MSRRPFTITNLRRDPDGFWRARVTHTNGTWIDADTRAGSWQCTVRDAPGARSFHREFVLIPVAVELQAQVKTIEGRERRAARKPQQELILDA